MIWCVSRRRRVLKEMFSWKTTLLPFIILWVASFYFPQEGSTVSRFLDDIHQGIWDTVANFLRDVTTTLTVQTSYHVVGTALQRRRALLKAVIYDKDEASVKGNATNTGDVIKSLRYSRYEENSLCDLKEGIPGDEFDATVEEIAEPTNMPIKLKRVVQRARNFTRGNALAVNRLQFKTKLGNVAFGRIALLRKGDTLFSLGYVRIKKQTE